MFTITTAAHTAHLDAMTGNGLLVMPAPVDDLRLGGPVSLHSADWDRMLAELYALGWEPSETDEGDLCHEQALPDGRPVVGLYGHEPITSDPGLDECAAAFGELWEIVEAGRA